MEIKCSLLYKNEFEIVVYKDNSVYVFRYKRSFKNLKKAISYIKFKQLRLKHFKFNRKKRNEAKMIARKWGEFFNEK